MASLISCIFIISFLPFASTSIGDISPHFRRCIAACQSAHGCPSKSGQFEWWAREQCFSCRQQCIWSTVELFHLAGRRLPQFYGKWPFLPITLRIWNHFLAIQEPASMLFSLLNALTVWLMMTRIWRQVPATWHSRDVWLQFGWVGLFTWFSSTLFHCCDHWATEMLDYCSAFGLILFTLYTAVRFILPQWDLAKSRQISRRMSRPIGIGLLLFYLRYLHSMYMAPHFDYGFHIRCCVHIALFTQFLFMGWTFWECRNGRARKSMLFLGAAFLLGWFSAAFDALFDFPPLFWLFDAHSLFHLFSAPVPLIWAEFVCQEANRREAVEGKGGREE